MRRAAPDARIWAVVKANAYGHGIERAFEGLRGADGFALLDLDEAPPALVGLVRIGRPLYEPLKAVSSSCTEGIYPEFNDDLDMNDCLLLPNRLFWREAGGRPLLIRQTMGRGSMWETSTGSSVWGGGIVICHLVIATPFVFFNDTKVRQ
jgi:hypothetical protein